MNCSQKSDLFDFLLKIPLLYLLSRTPPSSDRVTILSELLISTSEVRAVITRSRVSVTKTRAPTEIIQPKHTKARYSGRKADLPPQKSFLQDSRP